MTVPRITCLLAAAVLSILALEARAQDTAADTIDDVPAAARGPLIREEPSAFQWSVHLDSEAVSDRDGGMQRGTASDTVVHAAMATDTQPLGLWAGGRFTVSAVSINSGQPSQRYVGDLQGVSNLEAETATRLYQLWYRQEFDRPGLWLKGGLMDMNQDLVAADSAATLLNSSFGLMPTLSANIPASTYPEPGFGLEAAATWQRWQYQIGLFQADPGDRSGFYRHGHLLIGEADYDLTAGGQSWGHYKLGLWQYRQSGAAPGNVSTDDRGAYGIVDQTLFRRGPRDLGVFVQLGFSPSSINEVPFYLGAGLQLRAPFRRRPGDLVTAGVAHARVRGDDVTAETTYELSYVVRVHRIATLQPDLQYVRHPGGQSDVNDAVVAILRLHLEFY